MSNRVIWVMGLSGSGKTTTITEYSKRNDAIYIDTDDLRVTMNSDLGWGKDDRLENVRRYAELAKAISVQREVIVGCTTPMKLQRELLKKILHNLILVELVCNLDLLVDRSVGNYYRRCGVDDRVPSLAGVNFEYEPTEHGEANFVFDTGVTSTEDILEELRRTK